MMLFKTEIFTSVMERPIKAFLYIFRGNNVPQDNVYDVMINFWDMVWYLKSEFLFKAWKDLHSQTCLQVVIHI